MNPYGGEGPSSSQVMNVARTPQVEHVVHVLVQRDATWEIVPAVGSRTYGPTVAELVSLVCWMLVQEAPEANVRLYAWPAIEGQPPLLSEYLVRPGERVVAWVHPVDAYGRREGNARPHPYRAEGTRRHWGYSSRILALATGTQVRPEAPPRAQPFGATPAVAVACRETWMAEAVL